MTRTPRRVSHRAAANGYLVVVQDDRSRYTSDGEGYPFKHESDDGYDAVEWAAALPHSNGKVTGPVMH
jgi:predicted acyl esterase